MEIEYFISPDENEWKPVRRYFNAVGRRDEKMVDISNTRRYVLDALWDDLQLERRWVKANVKMPYPDRWLQWSSKVQDLYTFWFQSVTAHERLESKLIQQETQISQ